MKNSLLFFVYAVIIASFVISCVEPYEPPKEATFSDILVLDGFLNASQNEARIRITHAVPLSSDAVPLQEDLAQVTLFDEDQNTFRLTAQGGGIYSGSVFFNFDKLYVLKVLMQDGEEYQSDPIRLTRSPEIDSITWEVEDQTLNITVNTHDDAGGSRYYQWDFTETFKYSSAYNSLYVYEEGVVRTRRPDEYIHECFKTNRAQTISIENTMRLSKDVVSKKVIHRIPAPSIKLSKRYTIEVNQSVITEDAYNYWDEVKKTTESIGGLFDPLPSAVNGNLHCITSPERPVIGYISGGETKSKRLYINSHEIQELLPLFTYRGTCPVDSSFFDDNGNLTRGFAKNSMISGIYPSNGPGILGYTFSSESCVDCRKSIEGGVLEKPDFWID